MSLKDPTPEEGDRGTTALVKLSRDRGDTGFGLDLLSIPDIEETNVLVVLYDASPDEWMRKWLNRVDARPANLGIVTIGDYHRSAAAASSGSSSRPRQRPAQRGPLTPIADPADLTELGVTMNEYLSDWGDDNQTVVFFDSLTSMLQWSDLERALQFLTILTDRIEKREQIAEFLVHPEAHDSATLNALEELFDVVVETVPEDAEEPPVDGPSPDTILSILSDERRRHAIRVLFEGGQLSVSDLADEIADDDLSAADAEIALYHTHLPRLAEAGFVEFDEATGLVDLQAAAERLRPFLQLVEYSDR